MFINYRNGKVYSLTSIRHPEEVKKKKTKKPHYQSSAGRTALLGLQWIYSRELKDKWLVLQTVRNLMLQQAKTRCTMHHNIMHAGKRSHVIRCWICTEEKWPRKVWTKMRINTWKKSITYCIKRLLFQAHMNQQSQQHKESDHHTIYKISQVQHCAKLTLQQNLHTSAKHSYSSIQFLHESNLDQIEEQRKVEAAKSPLAAKTKGRPPQHMHCPENLVLQIAKLA